MFIGFIPSQAVMEVDPFFDIDESIWVAEVGDDVVCAKTLRELQGKLPDAQILNYYPNGFVVERNDFPASTRVPYFPMYTMPKHKQLRIGRYLKLDPPKPVTSPPTTYDLVLDLHAQGMRPVTTAKKLKTTHRTVNSQIQKGRFANDLRVFRPKRKPSRVWTDEDDSTLRRYARESWSAAQIAAVLGVTRNAVIGRAHRRCIQLRRNSYSGRPRGVSLHDTQSGRPRRSSEEAMDEAMTIYGGALKRLTDN